MKIYRLEKSIGLLAGMLIPLAATAISAKAQSVPDPNATLTPQPSTASSSVGYTNPQDSPLCRKTQDNTWAILNTPNSGLQWWSLPPNTVLILRNDQLVNNDFQEILFPFSGYISSKALISCNQPVTTLPQQPFPTGPSLPQQPLPSGPPQGTFPSFRPNPVVQNTCRNVQAVNQYYSDSGQYKHVNASGYLINELYVWQQPRNSPPFVLINSVSSRKTWGVNDFPLLKGDKLNVFLGPSGNVVSQQLGPIHWVKVKFIETRYTGQPVNVEGWVQNRIDGISGTNLGTNCK